MAEHWLAKAEENIEAATVCLENGFYNASVNRCYYAMFHVAIAALLKFGIQARDGHWGHDYVQASLAEQLIKRRKILPDTLRSALLEVMVKRRIADYTTNMIGPKVAQRVLRKARNFVECVKEIVR